MTAPVDPARRPPAAWLVLAAFLLCTVIWGSTWLVIKWSHDERLPPLTAAALRFAIATAVFVPIQLATRARLPRGRAEWRLVVFVGVVLIGLDYGLIYWAEQWLESGLTSVLFASMTLFTALLAVALGLEKLSARKLVGIATAIAGVVVLCADQLGLDRARLLPSLAIVAAAFCSASTTAATKRWGHDLPAVTLNTGSFFVGTLCLLGGAFAAGEEIALPSTAAGWGTVAYLSLVGSVLAFLVYFWLLKHWDASRAGLIAVLIPVIALGLGTLLRGERLGAQILAGSVLVLGGVLLARSAGRRAEVPTRLAPSGGSRERAS